MLDLKRVLASAPKKHDKGAPSKLYTPWGEELAARAAEALAAEAGAAGPGAAATAEAPGGAIAESDAEVTAATTECCPLPEHPRPHFAREGFQVLNGWWECAFVPCADAAQSWRSAQAPQSFDGRVLVPFTPGTLLSSVSHALRPDELLWYRRAFAAPHLGADERLILHFQAVDYACACYVNGVRVGEHVGGYLPFSFDITRVLDGGSSAAPDLVIELCVFDPTDEGTQLRGKQQLESGGIWYTPQGGIWQTVWWEVVPVRRIDGLSISADARGHLSVTADLTDCGGVLEVTLRDAEGAVVKQKELPVPRLDVESEEGFEEACVVSSALTPTSRTVLMQVDDVRVWDVDDPYLYDLEVRYGNDLVRSYCGFRTVSMKEDERGVKRFYLNGRPVFLRGVLDQGYWSDGLLTAPSDEALVYDVAAMKLAGFNMLRKHIKVESARWYYHCDRLGMLVWQDAVSGGGRYDAWHTSYKPTLFRRSWYSFKDAHAKNYAKLSAGEAAYRAEWERTCLGMVDHLRNHPSIVTWVLFNEGWGQFEARAMTRLVRAADSSRAVDAVSGWYDQRCGDFHSVHNYFRPLEVWRDPAKPEDARDCFNASGRRAFVISEFGGLTFGVAGHCMFAGSYGYESFEGLEAWRAGVREALAQVDALEKRGLAGFVYTQLSDVEEEVNGLLTFDRRVNKLAGE